MGTCDGRTQSAHACKPALLHLALKTWVKDLHPTVVDRCSVLCLIFFSSLFFASSSHRQTHARNLVTFLSGLGFQNLDKWTLGFRTSILRSSTGARSYVLFFSRHFSLRPVVTDRRTQPRACLFFFLHLDGLKTPIYIQTIVKWVARIDGGIQKKVKEPQPKPPLYPSPQTHPPKNLKIWSLIPLCCSVHIHHHL